MQFCTELFCVDPWGSTENECRLVYFLCWDLLYNVTKGHMTSDQNMPLAWRVPQAVKMFARFGLSLAIRYLVQKSKAPEQKLQLVSKSCPVWLCHWHGMITVIWRSLLLPIDKPQINTVAVHQNKYAKWAYSPLDQQQMTKIQVLCQSGSRQVTQAGANLMCIYSLNLNN